MKYEIEMKKTEHKTVRQTAETPQTALKRAKERFLFPGFIAEYVTEIKSDEDGVQVVGQCFSVYGCCEGCSEPLLDDDVVLDAEGVAFCTECIQSLASDNLGG